MFQTQHLQSQSKPDSFLHAQLEGLLPEAVLDASPEDLPQGLSWLTALRVLLFYTLGNLASRAVVAMARAAGILDLSHSSLLSLLLRLEKHLHASLQATVAHSHKLALERAVRAKGFLLTALDATYVTSTHPLKPRSHGVHVLWEMTSQLICQIRVPDLPGRGETLSWLSLSDDMFVLADRVYCASSAFEKAAAAGAALCTRYRLNGCTLFCDEAMEEEFDVVAFVRAQTKGSQHSLQLWIRTRSGALPVRVDLRDMGQDWGEEQRKRMARNKQELSPNVEALLGHLVVVAYLPGRSKELVGVLSRLYRGRWGIEIEFKRMKSGRRLDELSFKAPRKLRAAICAHLLGQVMVGIAALKASGPLVCVTQMAHEYEVRQIGVHALLQSLIPLDFGTFVHAAPKMRAWLPGGERCKNQPRLLEWLLKHGIFD